MSQIKEGFNYIKPEEAGPYVEYLKLKYKTIEVLNDECKTNYKSFDDLDRDRPESNEYEKLGKNHLLWSLIRKEKLDKDHKHWDNIRNGWVHEKDNDIMYIVESSGKQVFYTKNLDYARLKMAKMASLLKKDYLKDYNCNIVYKTANSLQIVGNYKRYIVSYDSILERIDINIAPHC
uniref:Uncharacterized protein n=1 Tax=viral metagenome TaxID=1070528 RepID=A0A6C0LX23_9ZZZZ